VRKAQHSTGGEGLHQTQRHYRADRASPELTHTKAVCSASVSAKSAPAVLDTAVTGATATTASDVSVGTAEPSELTAALKQLTVNTGEAGADRQDAN
jgi:hypothetical protein